jgi:hypothetical protein
MGQEIFVICHEKGLSRNAQVVLQYRTSNVSRVSSTRKWRNLRESGDQ